MAVEATHLNLFPPQLIQHRDFVNPVVAQQMRFFEIPSAAALPGNHLLNLPAVCDSVRAKSSVNTDSGLTYNISAPRKRSRDSFDGVHAVQNYAAANSSGFSNAGDEILPQIQQYQFEIDSLISQHTKKIRMELEERQKQQARLLASAIGEGVMKKLKEKDEQIQRIGKLNLVLQERVKSLYVENQLWRDLAQTNEATANSLRSNLEQVLNHVGGEERVEAVDDDAESCCSSNGMGEGNEEVNKCERRCRICRERESCVLLLPCRHLCLCKGCGWGPQQVQSCPVCDARPHCMSTCRDRKIETIDFGSNLR